MLELKYIERWPLQRMFWIFKWNCQKAKVENYMNQKNYSIERACLHDVTWWKVGPGCPKLGACFSKDPETFRARRQTSFKMKTKADKLKFRIKILFRFCILPSYVLLRVIFVLSLAYLGVKAQQYFASSRCMFLDNKTLLKTWLNPGLNVTTFE